MTNSKSHIGFRLAPRSMTLDDLELHKFEFSVKFLGISQISDATAAKRMKICQCCQRQRCRHVELEQFWQAYASRGFVSDSWAFLFGATVIITITSGTVIASLSSTVLPPLGITILGMVGALSAALSTKFNLKKRKSQLQDAIREANTIKNKLEYVIMCNGDVDLSTFVMQLNAK